MKFCIIFVLLLTNICKGQEWQLEVMGGVAGYNGDLTERRISIKELRPGINLNFKYYSGNLINIRAGVAYARVGADDKNNIKNYFKRRNLNFKSDILEFNVIAEVNLFDPEIYVSYPYLFAGAGVFHFNPFTYDKDNRKTYLQPLSTEGQGLQEYTGRKNYELTQFCLPAGLGWIWRLNEDLYISYELGFRILFTDYLDDVSKTYVNLDVLSATKGPKSAELAYRGPSPFRLEGIGRGNSSINDVYFFSGVKLAVKLREIWKEY